MPDEHPAITKDEGEEERKQKIGHGAGVGLLLLNYFPFLHLILLALGVFAPYASLWWRVGVFFAVLLVIPPCLARLLLLVSPVSEGRIAVGSGQFFMWWTQLQFQILYCRFPFIEESLRMVPGLYSMWLRLWGARIGRLTYWSAGTLVLDRSFLDVGDDVVLGAGVRINPHVLQKREDGTLELLLGTVRIGDRASVGGYSLLTAGCRIAAGESTHAFLIMPPFALWEGGRRAKPFRDGIRTAGSGVEPG